MSQQRLTYLDVAKGLAVIFMVVQHFAVWLWDASWSKSLTLFKASPLYFTMISFSGVSAPVFICVAGIGAFLFFSKYGDSLKMLRRGFVLLGFGYLLNLAIPSWFSPASWYVLHLIGFGYLVSPLLAKSKREMLPFIAFALLAASYLLQMALDTPFSYGNTRMGNLTLAWAPLRLAFLEGHFPILPWLAIFVTGFYAGEYVKNQKLIRLFLMGIVLTSVALLIAGVAHFVPGLEANPFLERLFELRVRFYPMLVPMFFLLTGLSSIIIFLLALVCAKFKLSALNPIAGIGRISLTVFISHVFVKQLVYSTGFRASFSKWETIAITTALLLIYAVAERFWKRVDYRFGFEWILRQLG